MQHEKKYRHKSARKPNWDYRSPGFYFVTIRTKNHQCYFGEIICDTQNFARLRATEIGKIAEKYWAEIPKHFPFVVIDEFIIMPDHLHGILRFTRPVIGELQPNVFGPQSRNLASVIRRFKSAVTKHATINNIEFAWQHRYHESCDPVCATITNDQELHLQKSNKLD